MTHWYLNRDGVEYGPFSSADLKAMVSSHQVTETDLLWREGFDLWMPASRIPGLLSNSIPPQGIHRQATASDDAVSALAANSIEAKISLRDSQADGGFKLACYKCGATVLRSVGKPLTLDGQRGKKCLECRATMGPARSISQLLLYLFFGLAVGVLGTVLIIMSLTQEPRLLKKGAAAAAVGFGAVIWTAVAWNRPKAIPANDYTRRRLFQKSLWLWMWFIFVFSALVYILSLLRWD